ncbi:MAG: hypothetical protein JST58_19935 [Bacteroidetes bacterium]|nr:hypothetical protein [Bacteroidota bacterium]
MRFLTSIFIFCIYLVFFFSCKKNSSVKISSQRFAVGEYIQQGDTLNSKNGSNGRTIKGTLKSGQTYYLSSDFKDAVVNAGDTLLLQSGVTVLIVGPSTGPTAIGSQEHAPGIVVNGTFLSIGTRVSPILFTLQDANLKSNNALDPQDPNTDPAYKGYWGGIQGGVGGGDIIIKWTRLEYLGGLGPLADPYRPAKTRYGIWFRNPSGNFVLEDSWIYGTRDDYFRVTGGKYHIMRNTFEKCGFSAGDGNIKSGSVGDIAYNLIIGATGNSFKTSNSGGLSPQSNMNCYNNTIINSGFRQANAGEGGSIDFENAGRGNAFNNLLVNCKYGLSILGGGSTVAIADTANIKYGNTYNYGDNLDITQQFLPSGYITQQQASDINGGNASLPSSNNPQFVNFPLPVSQGYNFLAGSYQGVFDFHLKTNSPAIGKGYTGFSPYALVKLDPVFGASEITKPGKDIGCFQTDGTGNQHH